MLPQGKLRRSQFSQKSSLCFSFSYFIFCGCSVNLYMLMSPLQGTYGHMVEKTPCWMANDAVRPWKGKDNSFLKDVFSLYSLSHSVVCHPAICPSQAEFRSHCCPHISNLGKLYDHVFFSDKQWSFKCRKCLFFCLITLCLLIRKGKKTNE